MFIRRWPRGRSAAYVFTKPATGTCVNCGNEFTNKPGPGRARKYCEMCGGPYRRKTPEVGECCDCGAETVSNKGHLSLRCPPCKRAKHKRKCRDWQQVNPGYRTRWRATLSPKRLANDDRAQQKAAANWKAKHRAPRVTVCMNGTCQADISHRPLRTRFCEACAKTRQRESEHRYGVKYRARPGARAKAAAKTRAWHAAKRREAEE